MPDDSFVPTDLGIDVPVWLRGTAFQASAVAHGIGDGTARVRVRTRRGLWLVCHASSLRDADGHHGTAVVIESAKAAEIAPIVIQAYNLSDREQQITRLIARGASTAEIADELILSTHTVRGYIKDIFHKVDVSSQGELVAKVFAETSERYDDIHRSCDIVQVAGD